MRFLSRYITLFGLVSSATAALADTAARDYLAAISERQGSWVDHGEVAFPSGQVFFGDPTNGDDTHIRTPRPAPAPDMRIFTYTYQFIWQGDGSTGEQNGILWLEASGLKPVRKSERISFGADSAVIGFGDLDGGRALVELGRSWQDQGKGDSFEFLMPVLEEMPYMATRKVPIPESDTAIYLVTTGTDGGFDAVWLYDAQGGVSGILVDIAGRESDLKFIDTLIPE